MTGPQSDQLLAQALEAHRQGDLAAAQRAYEQVLQHSPDHPDALHLLGVLTHRRGDGARAVQLIRRAIAIGDNATFQGNLGLVLRSLGQNEQAVQAFRRAIHLQPDHWIAHTHLGQLLADDPAAELDLWTAYLTRSPDHPAVLDRVGVLAFALGRMEVAERMYRHMLDLDADNPDSWKNLGLILHRQGRLDDARHALEQAAQVAGLDLNSGTITPLSSELTDYLFQLSFDYLQQGRFDPGWQLYEYRHHPAKRSGAVQVPDFGCPQWTGQDLTGKSILVWPEQGYGDDIQFVRYLSVLRRLGAAHISLLCKTALGDLFAPLPDADAVLIVDPRRPDQFLPKKLPAAPQRPTNLRHDYWVLGMGIAAAMWGKSDTPYHPGPYLSAPADHRQRWAAVGLPPGPKIGVVWRGNPEHKNDHHRSLPGLDSLAPLLTIPGLRFFSLQHTLSPDEADLARRLGVYDLSPGLDGFANLAACIERLDLLIAVDTAAAHLAGALGKECWCLLPAQGTDWRWGLDGQDTPWYPATMRLYRQGQDASWPPVIQRMADDLRFSWPRPRVEDDAESQWAQTLRASDLTHEAL